MSVEATPTDRRRLRVSVRLLMALVLLAALVMGYFVNKAYRQRRTVAAVRSFGGRVHYDWELVNGQLASGRWPPGPGWLRRSLGDEYFQEITHVSLVEDDPTGSWYYAPLTPADALLSRLAGTTTLMSLRLKEAQATDRGLGHLRPLSGLEEIMIWDASEVSDAGLAHLASLKNLRHVHISNSRMTDAGLAHLAKLPKLEHLSLQGNHFTDAGLALLKGSTSLKRLCLGLGDSRITDEGLVHLKGLTNLELLDLQEAEVTDKGLEHLKGLSNLREIWLGYTGVTGGGKAAFQAAMPKLKVIR